MILLDTHCFVWALSNSSHLSPTARQILSDRSRVKILSYASVWEMAIKMGLKRLWLPASLETTLSEARARGLHLAQLDLRHIMAVEHLPTHHRDPFDRLLVSYCLLESTELLSCDAQFDAYGVQRVWQ